MYKILSYWLIPSRPEKSFTYTSTSACGKSNSSCRFSFSVARNTITKVFRFFFSYFGFLLLLGKVWTSLSIIKRYGLFIFFSSHNLKKFWQTTLDWEWWRLCRSFINLTECRGWGVSSWLAISNTREKIPHFFKCAVTAFLRAGNPYLTP